MKRDLAIAKWRLVYVESDVIIKMSMARIRDVYDPFRDHFVYLRFGLQLLHWKSTIHTMIYPRD